MKLVIERPIKSSVPKMGLLADPMLSNCGMLQLPHVALSSWIDSCFIDTSAFTATSMSVDLVFKVTEHQKSGITFQGKRGKP